MSKNVDNKGFSLLEILLVIALIAIIAAALYVALNPARRLAEANNSQRWTDVTAILSAVLTYAVDNNGSLPAGIDSTYTTAQQIGTAGSGCDSGCTATTTEAACLDLNSLVSAGYIASVPQDPQNGTASETDYYLEKQVSGAIIVGACDPQAEGGSTPTIKVAR